MPEQKKIARRQVRRIDGVLRVVFVDVHTGQIITNLDGYEISSAFGPANLDLSGGNNNDDDDDDSDGDSDSDSGGSSSSSSNDDDGSAFWDEWHRTHSKGSGNIAEDFSQAFGNLGRNLKDVGANVKVDVGNAVKTITGQPVTTTPPGYMPSWQETQEALTYMKDRLGGSPADPSKDPPMDIGIPSASTKVGEIAQGVMYNPTSITSRKYPPAPELAGDLAAVLKGAGSSLGGELRVVVNSGGQTPVEGAKTAFGGGPQFEEFGNTRTASSTENHDVWQDGMSRAADVQVYLNGNRVTPQANPEVFAEIAKYSAVAGFTQIAMGGGITHLGKDPNDPNVRLWTYSGGKWTDDLSKMPPEIRAGIQEGLALRNTPQGQAMYREMLQMASGPVANVPQPAVRQANVNPNELPQQYQGLELNPDGTIKLATPIPGREAIAPTSAPVQPTATTDLGAMPTKAMMDYFRGISPITKTAGTLYPDGSFQPPIAGTEQMPFEYRPNLMDMTPAEAAQEYIRRKQQELGWENGEMPDPIPNLRGPQGTLGRGLPTNNSALNAATFMGGTDPYGYIKDAYLAQINKAEGSPSEYTLFGYGTVADLSQHPNSKVWYNNGNDFSTAAGLYQMNYETWQEYAAKAGVTDFSAASQREAAWRLASDNYKANTGRDLLTDLMSDNEDTIAGTFVNNSNRWSSLPGGKQANSVLNELVSGFNEDVAAATAYKGQYQQPASDVIKNAPIGFASPRSVSVSPNNTPSAIPVGTTMNFGSRDTVAQSKAGQGFASPISNTTKSSSSKNSSSSSKSNENAQGWTAPSQISNTSKSSTTATKNPSKGTTTPKQTTATAPKISKPTSTTSSTVKNAPTSTTKKQTSSFGTTFIPGGR